MKKLLPKLNVNQKNPNENFVNPIIKKVIKDITSNMKDKDLTRLFKNCWPNTLGRIHMRTHIMHHLNLDFLIQKIHGQTPPSSATWEKKAVNSILDIMEKQQSEMIDSTSLDITKKAKNLSQIIRDTIYSNAIIRHFEYYCILTSTNDQEILET
ncbi:hypothetical protein RhiirA4_459094 [Rhizophagus irregularis]|uniref:Uncharacterized protein n=1 Tax=Rhizophagus irregularis TaxID=588596 RepID=A0A2I1GDM8_9GLOM|nr:hypothetical protein RhiirA4_459094 [Rhizophagus irregularis]